MADYETLEKLIADKGEPVLIINSEGYKTLEHRKLEDVYEQYAFYLNESVSGNCIVYGQTSFGWIMNPSLRFPVCALTKMVLESKKREVKAFSNKHESSFSKIARKLHNDDQKSLEVTLAAIKKDKEVLNDTELVDCISGELPKRKAIYPNGGIYDIGSIFNHSGGIEVRKDGDKYYWQVACRSSGDNWQEIPKYLYVALMTFEAESRNENGK